MGRTGRPAREQWLEVCLSGEGAAKKGGVAWTRGELDVRGQGESYLSTYDRLLSHRHQMLFLARAE
jgi:hypothetical protein